ncbi:hypothetical protein MB46_10390 [Arthrobacter alpinus]|uniref:hypothetical protein n=1 Tax=Arthrobacter alpinus TaxID=656366 RepID=UPI0005CA3E1C|nr:hypothetical protein [Arthrobacter alpinus]ALV45829.1 hypothetical protein MB46_10390 [Arthrobacter alpinus]
MYIRNISPLGDLDVPLLNQIVQAGDKVKVNKEQGEQLLLQTSNWEPVSSGQPPVGDLDKDLDAGGVPTEGES